MEPVDFYCERIAPGFGGEPFNMETGLAFLLVGIWAFRRAPASEDRFAALALALVGVFSFLQHATAVSAAVLTDMAANLLFFVALGFLLLRRLTGAGSGAALAGAVVATAAVFMLGRSPAAWAMLGPGADMFMLLAITLVFIGAAQVKSRVPSGRGIMVAGLVLGAGLPFRFLDGAACEAWPLGTHGIWHLFNAAAMAVLLATMGRAAAPRAGLQAGR